MHSRANPPEFHGRSFSSLSHEERSHWAGGEWRHVIHNGVFSWWWLLDDDWFFYPEAIYPYPTYIAPMLSVQETPAPTQPYWYIAPAQSDIIPMCPLVPLVGDIARGTLAIIATQCPSDPFADPTGEAHERAFMNGIALIHGDATVGINNR